MCRWFAYISPTEDCLLEDVLITPAHGITKQVSDHYLPYLIHHDPNKRPSEERENKIRNLLFNADGTGIAWYTHAHSSFTRGSEGPRPALYKTIQPPGNDPAFKNICANSATKVCFAHIRASSGTAIATVNNHPFVFGRHTIMHNGSISDFTAIKRELCVEIDDAAYAHIGGSTDSEHFAALYMTLLKRFYVPTSSGGPSDWDFTYSTSAMRQALERSIRTVVNLQKRILGPSKAQPNSLNIAVTDGAQMVAVRCRNHDTEQPPSLYYSTTAGRTLNRRYPGHPNEGEENVFAFKSAEEHGKHVIVASEPSTYDKSEWALMGKNTGIAVEADGTYEIYVIGRSLTDAH